MSHHDTPLEEMQDCLRMGESYWEHKPDLFTSVLYSCPTPEIAMQKAFEFGFFKGYEHYKNFGDTKIH